MDCSPPASFVHGISQARILECVAIFFSRGSSRPRDWTCVCCTCRQILYRWATREAPVGLMLLYKRNPTKFHFIMWRFSEKMAISHPRSSSSPSNKSAGTLVLDFLASRNVRNKFLLWNSVVKWSEVSQSCPTLCDPMDYSLPVYSTRGIFQARVLEWVAIEFMKSKPKSTHRDRDDQRKRGFLLTSLGPFFVRDNAKDTLSQPAVFQFLHVAH